uniref:Uncharacterized protein n=1 Tax=Aegilops tauschii TaxID=37682 RepID=M8BKG5_AEGTA
MAPEILLRLPPDDPPRLVRASLVCWRWRRLLTDPAYLRRYRAFHRTPPMLGFVLNLKQHYQGMAQLVPTSSFRPADSDRPGLNVLDARHGRVLLHTAQGQRLVVWDPVTGEECKIPRVPSYALGFNAAAGAWSQRIEIEQPAFVDGRPSVLVGNTLYFTCDPYLSFKMLGYNIVTQELSVIWPPSQHEYYSCTVLVKADDGKLGFAGVQNGTLYLWSMKDGADGYVEWVQRRVIQHKTMLRTRGLSTPPEVVGFADGHGFIFVRTGNTVFSMDLKSGHVRKVYTCRSRNYDVIVVPYMSFCTPVYSVAVETRKKVICNHVQRPIP